MHGWRVLDLRYYSEFFVSYHQVKCPNKHVRRKALSDIPLLLWTALMDRCTRQV